VYPEEETMGQNLARFCALFFTGLALVPAAAHLSELPNKMQLTRDDYLTVQQIYRGWAMFGVIVVAALASTVALAWTSRGRRAPFRLALCAALCIVGTQAVFWSFTQPANIATSNWTHLPPNWHETRLSWEYSHAASALLNLVAFTSVALAVTAAAASPRAASRSSANPGSYEKTRGLACDLSALRRLGWRR
jgi:hypothetical protein